MPSVVATITKGAVFDGIVAAKDVAGGGADGTFPDACMAESNVTQHEGAVDHDALANTHDLEGTSILSSGPAPGGYVLTADGAGAAAWEAPTGGGGYTDEEAQDAVGAMCTDGSLVYVDAIPLLTRGALTGDVTAEQGGSATTIAARAVTYAQMQAVSATDTVLGRATAGAGDVEEIACTAQARALLDDATAGAMLNTLGAAAATHNHTAAQITSLTLAHERGGLEADVSAYEGLVKIVDGVTSYVGVPLQIANGGTTATSFTANQLVRANATATALESSGKTVPTGDIVGTSDTQTLTGKTLTSPKIATAILNSAGTAMLREAAIGVVTKVIHIPNPTAADEFAFDFTNDKTTLLGVWAETDTGTADLNIERRAFGSGEGAGTDILSADLQVDDDGATTTTFAAGGVVDGTGTPQWLVVAITSVASSPTDLKIAVVYKRYAA